MPEPIKIIPYDELPPVVEGQHHYLLLCIDQWARDPRPDGVGVPIGEHAVDILRQKKFRAFRLENTNIIKEQLPARVVDAALRARLRPRLTGRTADYAVNIVGKIIRAEPSNVVE